jgi:hypothetical protein
VRIAGVAPRDCEVYRCIYVSVHVRRRRWSSWSFSLGRRRDIVADRLGHGGQIQLLE